MQQKSILKPLQTQRTKVSGMSRREDKSKDTTTHTLFSNPFSLSPGAIIVSLRVAACHRLLFITVSLALTISPELR